MGPNEQSLEKMTVAASVLGWKVPLPEADWPASFDREGKTWTKDHLTVAQKIQEVQCGEYTCNGDWLIVYNE